MKFLLLSALVALCAVTRVWCEEIDPREESDYWSSNQIQVRLVSAGGSSELLPNSAAFFFNCSRTRRKTDFLFFFTKVLMRFWDFCVLKVARDEFKNGLDVVFLS